MTPENAKVYSQRGLPYMLKREFDKAIDDFSRAIKLKPDFVGAYCFREMVRLHTREWDKAREDLNTCKGMSMDIVDAFHHIYRSVGNYERIVAVKLPEDIAAMLTQP